jgi:lysophospholipid hydrolase
MFMHIFTHYQVFHELARHLQTRRLVAGDSISLDQDKSFYCVVDGTVQVYAHTGQQDEAQHSLWEDEDMNGYRLINEVGPGGMLSSLFTILSLFTENVQLTWQDNSPVSESPINDIYGLSVFGQRLQPDTDVPSLHLDIDEEQARGHSRRSSRSSTASTVHGGHVLASPERVGVSSPGYLGGSSRNQSFTTTYDEEQRPSRGITTSVHRGVIFRATEDSTLAVIPAEAFKRLTKNFPKATGHMVQGTIHRPSEAVGN